LADFPPRDFDQINEGPERNWWAERHAARWSPSSADEKLRSTTD